MHYNKLAAVYLIHGDEYLLVQENRDSICLSAKEQGFSEHIRLQADKSFNWQNFTSTIREQSLFSDKQLIELHMPSAKIGVAGSKILQECVQNYLQDKILLITSGKLDKSIQKTGWYKAIDSVGKVIPIWPIDANHLPGWVSQRMRNAGLKTDAAGLKLLAEYSEGNLLAAAQEIEKLALLYPSGFISVEQIMEAVVDNARFDIFGLTDSILQADAVKSIRILHGLKNTKTEPVLILWALTRQIRELINIAETAKQIRSVDQAMQQYRVWQQKKPLIKQTLRKHELGILYGFLQQCAKLDRVIKGAEKGNVWDEFERLSLSVVGIKYE